MMKKMASNYSEFLTLFNLDGITNLRDSFMMRRQTILANCGIMQEKLDDEYRAFEAGLVKFNKETSQIQELFLQFADLASNPKSYYDLPLMSKALADLSHKISFVTKIETDVNGITKDVNSKVYALVTLFNNSIQELVQNTLKSKAIVLDLLTNASEGLKDMSQKQLLVIKEMSQELEMTHNDKVEAFFANFYENLIDNFGEASPSEKDQQEGVSEDRDRLFKEWEGLCSGNFLTKEILIELSEFLAAKIGPCMYNLTSHESSTSEFVGTILETINVLKGFDLSYTELKKGLKASTDSDEFYKTLYANYNTEMNFVIKNYFIFWDIMQKAIRKIFKGELDTEVTQLESSMATSISELSNRNAEIEDLLKSIRELAQMLKGETEHQEAVLVDLSESLKKLDSKLRLLMRSYFTESQVFISQPISVLTKTLVATEKMFKEFIEHSDIEQSFLSVIDSSEAGMLETLKADGMIRILIDKKVDVGADNQLVFTSEFNLQPYCSTLKAAKVEWNRDMGGFLRPSSLSEDHKDKFMADKDKLSDKYVSPEVEALVELSEDDHMLASTHQYDARVNKKNIPLNGTATLMNDYFIFCASSVAGTMNLVVPYSAISEVKPKKNFIGLNNGAMITTRKGPIEFYLSNNTKRDEFISQLMELIKILKIGETSPINKEFMLRNFFIEFKDSKGHKVEYTEDDMDNLKIRHHLCMKKMRVGLYNSENVSYVKRLPKGSFCQLINLWFSVKPYIYEGSPKTNFLHHWRDFNGCSDIELCTFNPLPEYLSKCQQSGEKFLESPLNSVYLTLFSTKDKTKLKERMNIIFTHSDQVAVVFSVSSNKQLEYECLLLIRQGESEYQNENPFENNDGRDDSVVVKMWRRRGLNSNSQVKDLYFDKFMDFMVATGEQMQLAAEGKESKFEEMK